MLRSAQRTRLEARTAFRGCASVASITFLTASKAGVQDTAEVLG